MIMDMKGKGAGNNNEMNLQPRPRVFSKWTRALVGLALGASFVGIGAYAAAQQGWWPFSEAGSGTTSKRLTAEQSSRFKSNERLLKTNGANGRAAAEAIINEAATLKAVANFDDSPEVDRAVFAAANFLLRQSKQGTATSGADADRARFAIALLHARDLRVQLALAILRGSEPSSMKLEIYAYLLSVIKADVGSLPQAMQDEVRGNLATYVASTQFANPLESAFLIARGIVSPSLRATIHHDIAVARLGAVGKNSGSSVATAIAKKSADGVLIQSVWTNARKSNVQQAVVLALAIADQARRDRMVRYLVSTTDDDDTLWRLAPALLGISDQIIRDDALIIYIQRCTQKGFTHEALIVLPAVSKRTRALASAIIAASLSSDGYSQKALQVLPNKQAVAAAESGQKDVTAAYTASALANLGRLDEARTMLSLTSGKMSEDVSSAAVAIAEGYARGGATTEDLVGLSEYALADDLADIISRAAIVAAKAGNVAKARSIVDSQTDATVRVYAAALLALEVKMPAEWTTAFTQSAKSISRTKSDLNGLLAAFATSQTQTDLGWQYLKSASNPRLIARTAREIARQLALQGRINDLNRLYDVLPSDDAAGRDSLLRSAVMALADNGKIDRAANLARGIVDYKVRTATLRNVARLAAHDTDPLGALEGRQQDQPTISVGELGAPLVRRASFNIYEPNSDVGAHIPTLPNASVHTAATVFRTVPVSGSDEAVFAAVVPLANNGFNKKFLTARQFEEVVPGGPTVVMRAQGTSYPVYLHIDRGVIDLPTLYEILTEQGRSDLLLRDGRTYTLRVPLFISSGATLVISDADVKELRLSNERASYIVNAGKVFVTGVRLTSWSEVNDGPVLINEATKADFRPFFIGWSNSVTNVARSSFVSMGHSSGKAYGFSFSSGPLSLMSEMRAVREPTGIVIDSSFEDMLYGFYSYEAADVVLVGNEYRNNFTYGIDPHDWSKRLLVAYNTAYGSKEKHGIIGSRHVEDSWFIGNMSFSNHGSGFMMDRFSGRNILYGNTSFDNGGSGISIYESPCNIVSGNNIYRNKGNGIIFRNSWDVGIFKNTIRDNQKLGIGGFTVRFVTKPGALARNLELDPYETFTTSAIAKNLVSNNGGGGIGIQGMGAVAVKANSIAGPASRAYLGDLREVELDIVRQVTQGVVIGGSCPKPKITYTCGFIGGGYLSNQLMAVANARPRYDTCPKFTTVDKDTLSTTAPKNASLPAEGFFDEDNDVSDKSPRRATGSLTSGVKAK